MESETTDSPENTMFLTICLLTVQVSTLWSPNRFVPCLSGDLRVYHKIQPLILGRLFDLLLETKGANIIEMFRYSSDLIDKEISDLF